MFTNVSQESILAFFVFRFKYGGKQMFFRLARDPWLKDKVVILSHDIAHR